MKSELSALISSELSTDPLDALEAVARGLYDYVAAHPGAGGTDYVDVCQVYGFLRAYLNKVRQEVGFSLPEVNLGTDRGNNLRNITAFVGAVLSQIGGRRVHLGTEAAIKKGEEILNDRFIPPVVYEFGESDVSRLNSLIAELRQLIINAEELTEGHKQRLLRRLDGLQSEVAKKVSNVDLMWGVAGEVWMTAKTVIANPEKANEWMTVIAKLLAIVAAAQAMAHGLPTTEVVNLLPWLGEKNDFFDPTTMSSFYQSYSRERSVEAGRDRARHRDGDGSAR